LAAGALHDVVTWARRFREAGLPHMLVGAFAVAAHGLIRTTGDIDFVLHMPFEERGRVLDLLRRHGLEEVRERLDPQWGKRLAADLPSGLMLEVFFTPPSVVHDREYDRRVFVELQDERIPILAPEDLVLRKLVNTRLRRGLDYDDAVGVIARQGARLDLDYLRAHASFYRVGDLLERAIKEAKGAEPDRVPP
jgi:hypothetical protein